MLRDFLAILVTIFVTRISKHTVYQKKAYLYRKMMENFELKDEEYIELKNLIKLLGWVETGGDAKFRIDNQEIKVNGEIETQRRKKIRRGDIVTSGNNQVQVK